MSTEDEADMSLAEAVLAQPGDLVELETFLAAEGI